MILITLSSNIVINTVAQTKNPIIVDKNGEGDYKTITEAIQNVSNGATIYIKNGEYKEIINIKKKITLIGEDKEKTIINPASEKNMYAILIATTGVKIKNLGITNEAPGIYTAGIRISASETTIENSNIYNTSIGVLTWTSDNTIKNCDFWGCRDEGIALLGSEYSNCDNNKITNCVFYDNCDGIELQYSSNNIITNCEFYENTHTGIDAIASSNNDNIIKNCNIYNNRVNGIYFSSSSRNQIINCYISDNIDGNIILNKNSQNNQISLKNSLEHNFDNTYPENEQTDQIEYEENQETSRVTLLSKISELISKLKMNRIITFFSSRSF